MADGQLVTIAAFNNSFEAELAKITLESEGIKALVVGDNLDVIQPYSFPYSIELQVFEKDAERAIELLNQKEPLSDNDNE